MKLTTHIVGIALILLTTASYIPIFTSDAGAQRILPDARAVTQCYNTKLKASGKYVNCLLRAERTANMNMVETSADDVAACNERFEQRYMRAEAQAAQRGTVCPSHGDLSLYQQTIVGATSTINSSNDVKTVLIDINPNDLAQIISQSLNLNIAIKVNGVFNVVWRSIPTANIVQSMEFQWSPVFQVYGAEELGQTEEVDIETNVVDIALGQDAVFGVDQILATPMTGNNPNGITFINNSGNAINTALAQLLTLAGSTQAITSIFYGDNLLPSGQSEVIIPTQEVLIWFEQNTNTGDIIFIPPSQLSTMVDFTDESAAILNFSDMQWSAPQFE